MIRLKNILIGFLGCLLTLISSYSLSQPKSDSQIYLSCNNKVIIWEFGGKKYAAHIPSEFTFSTTNDSDNLQIGFVHSGYSSPEVDGKNALLTYVVIFRFSDLNSSDSAIIQKEKYIFDENVLTPSFSSLLNVGVNVNKQEEERLRNLLGYPIKLNLNTNIPGQIKWSGIKGNELYLLLTSEDGLRITAELDISLKISFKSKLCFEDTIAEQWWKEHAKPNENKYILRNGIDPFLIDLRKNKVIYFCNSELEDTKLWEILKERVRSLLSVYNKKIFQISKAQFLSIAQFNIVSDIEYSANLNNIENSLSPGILLKLKPKYVKDLSGNGNSGLEALK